MKIDSISHILMIFIQISLLIGYKAQTSANDTRKRKCENVLKNWVT